MAEPEPLKGTRVAALVAEGFQEAELIEPMAALEEAGATVEIVAPESHHVRVRDRSEPGDEITVDHTLDEVRAADYDALLLPGGITDADRRHPDRRAIRFVRQCFDAGRPIAVISHAPRTLIETGALPGIRMTSDPSVKEDLESAGAEWVDEDVVVDHGIVSAHGPEDIPAFNRSMIETFAEGRYSAGTDRTIFELPS